MAQYTVSHVCGHRQTHVLFGPHKDRDSRLAWLGTVDCTDCFRESIHEKREAAAGEAREKAGEYGLPDLVGSPKQVTWAEQIRGEWIEQLEDPAKRGHIVNDVFTADSEECRAGEAFLKSVAETTTERPSKEAVWQVIEPLLYRWTGEQAAAKTWIDNRFGLSRVAGMALCRIAWTAMKGMLSGKRQEEIERERREAEIVAEESRKARLHEIAERNRIAAEAKSEATLRPEKPVSTLVAEVKAGERYIMVLYPEKNEALRSVVKSLGFTWSVSVWLRSGTDETIVETGHRLLSAGFPVEVQDPELRRRIVAAEYMPENFLKVMARVEGEFAGWFCIQWPRSADYYHEAHRLRGARYLRDKTRGMVVPAGSWEEVLDFAERYGFCLTDAAQGIVQQQREIRAKELPCTPAPAPKGAAKPKGRLSLDPQDAGQVPECLLEDSLEDSEAA